jgi:sugar phosphate isomerase/epimerase
MENAKWSVGICSWSLQADVAKVGQMIKDVGIDHVHLAVGPALGDEGRDYLAAAKEQDWVISATMIAFPQEDYSTLDTIKVTGGVVPDDCWESNKELFAGAARITKELGVKYLSMHAGFIDHTDEEKYKTMSERIKCLGDIAADNDIILLMETGQEGAKDLADFLKHIDHPAAGINFDPANMILYDKGDPIEAVEILSPWIKHVHIKDANRTETPGQWGTEVPWGDGQVSGDKFLATLKEIGYEGTLAIECEAGGSRLDDIALAAERLRNFKG